jgi:hypothetical protein
VGKFPLLNPIEIKEKACPVPVETVVLYRVPVPDLRSVRVGTLLPKTIVVYVIAFRVFALQALPPIHGSLRTLVTLALSARSVITIRVFALVVLGVVLLFPPFVVPVVIGTVYAVLMCRTTGSTVIRECGVGLVCGG